MDWDDATARADRAVPSVADMLAAADLLAIVAYLEELLDVARLAVTAGERHTDVDTDIIKCARILSGRRSRSRQVRR